MAKKPLKMHHVNKNLVMYHAVCGAGADALAHYNEALNDRNGYLSIARDNNKTTDLCAHSLCSKRKRA